MNYDDADSNRQKKVKQKWNKTKQNKPENEATDIAYELSLLNFITRLIGFEPKTYRENHISHQRDRPPNMQTHEIQKVHFPNAVRTMKDSTIAASRIQCEP